MAQHRPFLRPEEIGRSAASVVRGPIEKTGLIRSSVVRMAGYTPGEQPAETGVIKLNTNENPYPPSPLVARALREMDAARLRLYPDPLCKELRRRIAGMHGCSPEQVFIGNGSDEILSLATRAFVEDTGKIGYFVPSYSLYPVLAAARGAASAPVELGPRFEWTMPKGYSSDLFFLANPNAPTGMLFPKNIVKQFCRRHGGVVLIDEAYANFAEEDCMDLAVTLDNVIVSRTLSKAFSLAGLRVGYAVGPRALVEALFKIKDSYNVDALSQRLALAAVSDLAHMRRNARKIAATRRRLSAALAKLKFEVFPSQANFIWTRPSWISACDLFAELRRRKIFVRHFPGPRTGDYLRITIGTDHEVARLVAEIRNIMRGRTA